MKNQQLEAMSAQISQLSEQITILQATLEKLTSKESDEDMDDNDDNNSAPPSESDSETIDEEMSTAHSSSDDSEGEARGETPVNDGEGFTRVSSGRRRKRRMAKDTPSPTLNNSPISGKTTPTSQPRRKKRATTTAPTKATTRTTPTSSPTTATRTTRQTTPTTPSTSNPTKPATRTTPSPTNAAAATTATATTETKISPRRIPPIVLRDKARYNSITQHFKLNRVDFGQAKATEEGVRLHPPTIEDYRRIIRHLDANKIPYHSFQLPDEKLLHVVFRGMLETWTTAEVKEELTELGFHPVAITRWHAPNGAITRTMLVLVPKEEKTIFNVTKIKDMKVKAEAQRTKSKATQCHNCQLYGHSSFKCTAPPKCVKCAGDHHTTTCKKPRDIDAKCANCGGPHPASFQGCPKHPKHSIKATTAAAAIPTFQWGAPRNTTTTTPRPAAAAPAPTNAAAPSTTPPMFEAFAAMHATMQKFMNDFNEEMKRTLLPLLHQTPQESSNGRKH